MANIVLGVSSGIAAYKSVDLMRTLQRAGHDVRVVMTENATRFVGPETFAALSGHQVGIDVFGREFEPGFDHLEFARFADVMLICPASANTIAAIASGFADGLLTTSVLAFDGPLVLAPAMNTKMWQHPATQANLATLKGRGVHVIPPAVGLLADGDVGPGRLPELEVIFGELERVIAADRPLQGVAVLITAGGTREPIDAVRYVGNRSSGKMAWALAEEASHRGAKVTVIAANVDLPRRPQIIYVDTPTAREMLIACRAYHRDADIVIMAAAVADYRPSAPVEGKIEKSQTERLEIRLERTTDILSELGASRRDGQVLVGFAAEAGAEGLQRAHAKRVRKGVDLIVYNDIAQAGIGFGSDQNSITIIGSDDHEQAVPRASKRDCARNVLDAALAARDLRRERVGQ
jgi:phosphopantothenoylcysteine decarboxylase / phosphopantothenate---cysteine ligase